MLLEPLDLSMGLVTESREALTSVIIVSQADVGQLFQFFELLTS